MLTAFISAPFYSSNSQTAHSIAGLAGLGQSLPPGSQGHPASTLQSAGVLPQAPVPQPPGYSLPALGQTMQQPSMQQGLDRDREIRQMELREREVRERQRHQDELTQREREREQQERETRERQQRESQPHQNHTGSIPIHQPVASKVSTAIHGPGGLLSTIGPGATSNSSGSLVHPGVPPNVFGPSLQIGEAPSRSVHQITAPSVSHQVLSFGATHAVHPVTGGITGLSQGQQPILNVGDRHSDQPLVRFRRLPHISSCALPSDINPR